MDVKEAVKIAKDYVADVFSDDKPFNIGLEEVEHDEAGDTWRITVGFSRPWNRNIQSGLAFVMNGEGTPPPKRSYRVVSIEKGMVKSVTRYHQTEA